jgi:hypothetical protein
VGFLTTGGALTIKPAIGLSRGLGLAAQRHDIEIFGEREEFSILSWRQDIQTVSRLTFVRELEQLMVFVKFGEVM